MMLALLIIYQESLLRSRENFDESCFLLPPTPFAADAAVIFKTWLVELKFEGGGEDEKEHGNSVIKPLIFWFLIFLDFKLAEYANQINQSINQLS